MTVYVNILGNQYDCSNDLCVLVLCFVFGRMTQVDILLVLFSTLLIEITQGPHVTDSSIIFHSIRVKLLVGMGHGGPAMRCPLASFLSAIFLLERNHMATSIHIDTSIGNWKLWFWLCVQEELRVVIN